MDSARVVVPADRVRLLRELTLPPGAVGVAPFARGSDSSLHSPRHRYVAQVLHDDGLGTLLFDLSTPAEGADSAQRCIGPLRDLWWPARVQPPL